MSEPDFLGFDDILRIHARSLAEHGGRSRCRIGFPRAKRRLCAPSTWELYSAMIDVAEKKKNKSDLAEIFRKRATE